MSAAHRTVNTIHAALAQLDILGGVPQLRSMERAHRVPTECIRVDLDDYALARL